MTSFDIPTIDVSHFFRSEENEEGKKKAMEQIRAACVNYGFFQIVNHGIPLELLSRTMDAYETFFACADEVKLTVPDNYLKSTRNSAETYEHLAFRSLPQKSTSFQYEFKVSFVFSPFIKFLCLILLGKYWRRFPATEDDNIGKPAHVDPGFFTILYQDEVKGLQVHKDGQWIPIEPSKDKLVVNIGDVIQVLSNNKFKSAPHRAVRPRETNRYLYAFFYNGEGDKWVEPLPQFTKETGESPKYRGDSEIGLIHQLDLKISSI
ncbi:2-oxoglutarate-dependent dioxygenase citB-like [Solanum dulcamara]|uniref:2-oxoglutarate-dependent dioxygenase citB-like n=1 Tax=Solanum dulcamara TaxID=45834 RepID=UPI002485B104|nr:2-oxoglutarate-dependent dioxygenase citB-like [Solanum dulcamara]